jgi:hypothetical protein
MTREDLIFDWREGEGGKAWSFFSWVVVGVLAVAVVGVIDVRFMTKDVEGKSSAGVMCFLDEEMKNYWRMKAEEDGPFPGGMRIGGAEVFMGLQEYDSWNAEENWSGYELKMRTIADEGEGGGMRVSDRGMRYFPERRGMDTGKGVEERVKAKKVPVISVYEKDAGGWIPDELPVYKGELALNGAASSWRFMLKLRGDGTVEHCMPLSGGEGELEGVIRWLEGIQFKGSDEESRWMGLRVEFSNITDDGSDAK